jgi:hypothetical protein
MFNAKFLEDGTILARAGTQTNCGGLAVIGVNITENEMGILRFFTSDFECEHEDGYGMKVAGAKVPVYFREYIFAGAKEAFVELVIKKGIDFELVNALVHQIDARESKFQIAGRLAVTFWFENQTLK